MKDYTYQKYYPKNKYFLFLKIKLFYIKNIKKAVDELE